MKEYIALLMVLVLLSSGCVEENKIDSLEEAFQRVKEEYPEDYVTPEQMTNETAREIEGGYEIKLWWGYCKECYYIFSVYENGTVIRQRPE